MKVHSVLNLASQQDPAAHDRVKVKPAHIWCICLVPLWPVNGEQVLPCDEDSTPPPFFSCFSSQQLDFLRRSHANPIYHLHFDPA